MKLVLLCAVAYLMGSIPWAYLITKWLKGEDIREHGSGNVGFTNAIRVIGKKWASLVLIGDIAKGFLPVFLAINWQMHPLSVALISGMAILGHVYPVFLGFKGGKGAAIGFGVMLAISFPAAILNLLIWLLVISITRYVSLGSIVAALSLVVILWLLQVHWIYLVFAVIGGALVIYKHLSNIKRLLAGTEHKIGKN